MKTKVNLKLAIALIVMLLALVFNMNTVNAATVDEEYVKSLTLTDSPYYEVELGFVPEVIDSDTMFAVNEKFLSMIEKYYSKQINNDSVGVKAVLREGGGSTLNIGITVSLELYVNDTLCDTRAIGSQLAVPVVTVPATISESEINSYVKSEITKLYKDFGAGITSITEGTTSIEGVLEDVDIPNGYTVISDYDGGIENYIVIKKAETTNEELVNNFPNTISLDTTVKEQVESIAKGNNELDISNISFKVALPEGYSIQDNKIYFEQAGDLFGGTIKLNYNNEDIGTKQITVEYNDTSKQNAETKIAVEELVDKFFNKIGEFNFEYAGELNKSEATQKLISDISNMTNIDNLELVVTYLSQDDEESLYYGIAIFVDDIYYCGLQGPQTLVKVTSTNVTTTDNETNIKLEAEANVIPSNTIMEVTPIEEGTTYNQIKVALSDMENFVAFDITLTSNGVEIQPNGKLKISIPIPEGFDTSNLVVFRVEEDKRIEYEVNVVTIDGVRYAQFETDHFSTYVLAEKNVTDTEETTPKGDKDNTPKTGTVETIYYILPVMIIATVGIIALKKKSSK